MATVAIRDRSRPPRAKGECSACGSPRLRYRERGNANDGSVPVWVFRCYDCNELSLGVMVMLEHKSTTLGALDEDFRRRRRLYTVAKRKDGKLYPNRGPYITSDTLNIYVKVIRGKRRGS